MGKPTGFMEYKRQGNTEIEPLERIKNFNEFHTPLNERYAAVHAAARLHLPLLFRCRRAAAWTAAYRSANPA